MGSVLAFPSGGRPPTAPRPSNVIRLPTAKPVGNIPKIPGGPAIGGGSAVGTGIAIAAAGAIGFSIGSSIAEGLGITYPGGLSAAEYAQAVTDNLFAHQIPNEFYAQGGVYGPDINGQLIATGGNRSVFYTVNHARKYISTDSRRFSSIPSIAEDYGDGEVVEGTSFDIRGPIQAPVFWQNEDGVGSLKWYGANAAQTGAANRILNTSMEPVGKKGYFILLSATFTPEDGSIDQGGAIYDNRGLAQRTAPSLSVPPAQPIPPGDDPLPPPLPPPTIAPAPPPSPPETGDDPYAPPIIAPPSPTSPILPGDDPRPANPPGMPPAPSPPKDNPQKGKSPEDPDKDGMGMPLAPPLVRPADPPATGCGCNAPIMSAIDALGAALGVGSNVGNAAIMAKLEAMDSFAQTAWKATHLDKVWNLLTLVAVMHNVSMLSRDIGETLGYAMSNALAAVGIEDSEGNPLDVNAIVGGSIETFIVSILGQDVYNDLRSTYQKANRIVQTASMVIWTVRSIQDASLDLLEWVGEHTGKIGNALKRFGVVGERAYPWMNERPTSQERWRRKFDRVYQGLETADDAASSFAMATSTVLEIQQETEELFEAKDSFVSAVEDAIPQQRPENVPVAQAATTEASNSQAPEIGINDTDRGG